ncbi:MAG: hypothetical protein A3G79_00885 [Gallionellales bacterium RIFCSPLOWO2_12_FULL_57_18]|nr:MAG: hypothetical protein A3G79_00885 [Gallionellales bacterium RIFCSPLOWO2_12_FULL_57_18]OGS97423.1 MAG: hypothetical protein A3H31_00190 [Gallionellales bacterium RIFCSPLOWO2_02_FULL_57_47]OGT17453.1 MAG: hypothetical protein A3J49_01055 [Gallionellales bacterium RIFCSPHIGHO2_02_FULL_57_16]
MERIHLALASSCVALLVAGCGGGDGYSATSSGTTIPTAAVQITPTNAPAVAKGAVTPAQGMVKTGSGQAGVVGVVAQASGRSRTVLDISLTEFNRARGLKFPPVVAGAVASFSLNCTTSGTVSVSFQDTNSIGTFDVGDIMTMAFNNCVEPDPVTGNLSTSNGSAIFAITSASGALGMGITPFSAAFTLTFSNFTSRDNATGLTDSINGDIGFVISDDGTNTTGTMSGTSLRMDSSADGAFLMTYYSISFTEANVPTTATPYSFSVNMTIASTVANGSVTVATTTPFTGQGDGDPTAGVMVITGANNSTLTLTALPDGVHVQMVVDEDGAGGSSPVSLTDTTWTAI